MEGTLFDREGKRITSVKKDIDVFANEECIEQDPEQWYAAFIEVINEIQGKYEDIVIDSVSVTYIPGTFVCIDRMGNKIMNAVLQPDSRSKYQARVLEKNYRHYISETRIPWDYSILPRLLWIYYNKPDISKKIFKVLPPDGYLSYRLCGESAIDLSSFLFMGFNDKSSEFRPRFANGIRIGPEIFSNVKRIGDCTGIISGEIRNELHFKSDIRFIVSSNSLTCLSQFLNEDIDIVYDLESSVLCFKGKFFKIRRGSNLIRLISRDEGVCNYGLIKNNEAKFLRFIDNLRWNGNASDGDYTPGANGLVVLPLLMGKCGFNESDIRGSILGIDRNTTGRDLINACYESIGYELREGLDDIVKHGVEFKTLGVISSIDDEALYHILADITSKNVIRIQNASISNGAFNMIGSGKADAAYSDIISPDRLKSDKYGELVELYNYSYSCLSDFYRLRRKITQKIIP